MIETITNSIGDRITYCRSSLCLTRKELIDKWGEASVPTLARWELDTVLIPNKKLISLVEFFQSQGLFVIENWIKDGYGTPPVLLKSELEEFDFDCLAQEKLLDLNRQIKHFAFGQVKNNLMAPIIKYGDYIGGSNLLNEIEISTLIGELIFIKKSGSGFLVGILEDIQKEITIRNFSNIKEIIKGTQIDLLGRIQWIIRRY